MRHSKKIVLGLFIFFLANIYISPRAYADTLQWPIKTNGIEAGINGLHANASNNISLMSCKPDNTLFQHFGDTYPSTTIDNTTSVVSCPDRYNGYGQIQTTADGTFYTYYVAMVNGFPEDRIAAIRDNKVIWSTSITSNDMCNNGNRSVPYSISIGPDGNIYTIITSNVISSCATYIAGFNGKTGTQIFKQYLNTRIPPSSSTTSWSYGGRLWTYDDKILLVDTNGLERTFSYSGIEDVSARYQFPNIPNTGAYGGTLLANQDGRVFVVYRTVWGCYPNIDGTYIHYHDTNGASGTSSLNLGCNSPDYEYKPTYDGNLAAYGYSGSLLIAHMTDNNHSVSDYPIPQGYTQSKVLNYWQDTSGEGVFVRQLTDASGARKITIDDVSTLNGTLTNIEAIDSNTIGYSLGDGFRGMGDVNSGNLYLPLCHTNCNSSTDRADNTWVHRVQLPNFGVLIRDTSQLTDTENSDVDEDGLTLAQEVLQGTSDHSVDTDGDGLSDYTESNLFTGRNTVFCGDANTTCNNYPNPIQKDLYVEIDWMKDGNNQSFQPTSAQLNKVIAAYAAKGITIHFDTGQYGGGNELPFYTQDIYFNATTSATDFYDYKNGSFDGNGISPNFNPDRYQIWHYMIAGFHYLEIPDSSGISHASDDDSFISFGYIKEHPNDFLSYDGDMDTAIAGTIIHELGHDSCLSQTQAYSSQPSSCIYSGVDAYVPNSYLSSMNYTLQMSMVDYSTGANAPGDHDDWSAISTGLGEFARSVQGDTTQGGSTRRGITLREARKLKREGRLGLPKQEIRRLQKRAERR